MLTISELNNNIKNEWWRSSEKFQLNMPRYTYAEKKSKEEFLDNLVDKIIYHISKFPKSEEERILWKNKGNDYLEKIIDEEEMFKLGVFEENTKEKFMISTRLFIKSCRDYDKSIAIEDIGQALRNIWIINIFQRIIGCEIEFTESIFAYSMLYPYTDNFLDDINISNKEKKDFNIRFKKRLNGEEIEAINDNEKKVFDMIEYIENQYDREAFKDIYKALLAIQEAQEKSLNQQEKISIPYENDILGISIEKGGTSVLADAYLINGVLSEEEQIFAYKYGFLLQICDDLQDIQADIENNHSTIISQIAGKYPLDTLVNKLINFTITAIDDSSCFKGDNIEELKKLIRENCVLMMLISVVKSKKYYSGEYIKIIDDYLPVTSSYIEVTNKKLKKKFKRLKPEYYGVSIENIIKYLFDI